MLFIFLPILLASVDDSAFQLKLIDKITRISEVSEKIRTKIKTTEISWQEYSCSISIVDIKIYKGDMVIEIMIMTIRMTIKSYREEASWGHRAARHAVVGWHLTQRTGRRRVLRTRNWLAIYWIELVLNSRHYKWYNSVNSRHNTSEMRRIMKCWQTWKSIVNIGWE